MLVGREVNVALLRIYTKGRCDVICARGGHWKAESYAAAPFPQVTYQRRVRETGANRKEKGHLGHGVAQDAEVLGKLWRRTSYQSTAPKAQKRGLKVFDPEKACFCGQVQFMLPKQKQPCL
jgi:hypothetical protein